MTQIHTALDLFKRVLKTFEIKQNTLIKIKREEINIIIVQYVFNRGIRIVSPNYILSELRLWFSRNIYELYLRDFQRLRVMLGDTLVG